MTMMTTTQSPAANPLSSTSATTTTKIFRAQAYHPRWSGSKTQHQVSYIPADKKPMAVPAITSKTDNHDAAAAADDDDDPLIFDFDLDDADAAERERERDAFQQRRRADSPVRQENDEDDGDPGGQHARDLAARVARQQRYVDNVRDQLGLQAGGYGGETEREALLRQAEEALETLRKALEQVQVNDRRAGGRDGGGGVPHVEGLPIGPRNHEDIDDDDGVDGGRGRGEQAPRGLDLTARREVQAELARLMEMQAQLRWMDADAGDLEEMEAEIRYLRDVLAGRYAALVRSPSPSSSSSEGGSGGSRRGRKRRQRGTELIGCYHGPNPLSDEDPRLPPPGVARTEPVELYDAEGPRYLALVTLDNPAPEARREEERVIEKAKDMFKRYEAQFFTVMERAIDSRALSELSTGPRGAIWVIEAGREDVLGAMLRAREDPFRIMSWKVLGVGRGGSEGMVFCLHKADDRRESEGSGSD